MVKIFLMLVFVASLCTASHLTDVLEKLMETKVGDSIAEYYYLNSLKKKKPKVDKPTYYVNESCKGTEPVSPNGPQYGTGCAGARWSTGNPSQKYCESSTTKNGWFKKCCKWKYNHAQSSKRYECIPYDKGYQIVYEQFGGR